MVANASLARTETKSPTPPRLRAYRAAQEKSRAKIDPSASTASKRISQSTGRSASCVEASTSIKTGRAVRHAQLAKAQRGIIRVVICAQLDSFHRVRLQCATNAQLEPSLGMPARLSALSVARARSLTKTQRIAHAPRKPTIPLSWIFAATIPSTRAVQSPRTQTNVDSVLIV